MGVKDGRKGMGNRRRERRNGRAAVATGWGLVLDIIGTNGLVYCD